MSLITSGSVNTNPFIGTMPRSAAIAAEILHHQAEARSRGGAHAFLTSPGDSPDGGQGDNLVLHLDEGAADIGPAF
jgi:hypothetical protein